MGDDINYEVNSVHHMDAFTFLAQHPHHSVNAIITDPPYQASVKGKDVNIPNKGYWSIREGWDETFDVRWLQTAFDLLVHGGSLLCFCSYHLLGQYLSLINNLEVQHPNDARLRQIIHWTKPNAFPAIRDYYGFSVEYILWMTKSTKGDDYTFNKSYLKGQSYINGNVIQLDKKKGKYGSDSTMHPSQKPLDLMKTLIAIHTNPNDIVLDPFAGSGTTGVAAKQLGRRYILVEREEGYIKTIHHRLEQEYLF